MALLTELSGAVEREESAALNKAATETLLIKRLLPLEKHVLQLPWGCFTSALLTFFTRARVSRNNKETSFNLWSTCFNHVEDCPPPPPPPPLTTRFGILSAGGVFSTQFTLHSVVILRDRPLDQQVGDTRLVPLSLAQG